MLEEEAAVTTELERKIDGKLPEDEGVDVGVISDRSAARGGTNSPSENILKGGTIRTLDGEMVGDELEGDALNYQILLGKIDGLLDLLKLDA